jgi:2'-5' RNA ligase
MPDVRTFIAVDLPAEVKADIGGIIGRLRPLSSSIRWVGSAGLHLTLKFLGSVEQERLPEIFAAVERVALTTAPFSFALAKMGGFPDLRRPRVLWIGIREGQEQLIELSEAVENALIPRGFPAERRPFSPPLTIGRVKSPQGLKPVQDRLPAIDYESGRIDVDSIKVMKSQLKPTGAEYSALKIVTLSSGALQNSQ